MNMTPATTQPHQTDGGMMHAQDLAQLDVGQVALLDQPHAFFCESSVASTLTPNVSSTIDHLTDVVGIRPKMKVGGFDTNWAVARVQDMQTPRRAVVDLVRQSMRFERAAMGANLSVPITVNTSGPVPAPVRRVTGHEPGENFSVGESSRSSAARSVRHPISVLRREPR